jgi:hypothetical protein
LKITDYRLKDLPSLLEEGQREVRNIICKVFLLNYPPPFPPPKGE